ncbi:T9SS type A sorting domain-containing protein, partial [bacterium]|nr:T9SS type A sorting domain-containing protein [bacterium]
GDTMIVGYTWYEYQHNSQIGRQIVLDNEGYIQLVWTNGLDAGYIDRHIYYNFISPEGIQGWPYYGTPVESAQRGGFTTMAVDDNGVAYVTFHQILPTGSQNPHSAVAVDFFPRTGAFLTTEIPWYNGQDLDYIWPRIAMKTDGEVLVTSVGSEATGQTWTLGTFNWSTYTMDFTPQVLTPPNFAQICNEVAASDVSNRVGGAWTATIEGAGGWDIRSMVDDDGLDLNFDNDWNVTNFLPPELSYLPDTLLANGDTLRAYADVSLFFDSEDYIHIAFTTPRWFELEGGMVYINASLIWHWTERYPNDYQLIANAFDPENTVSCGNWAFRAQRPCLGQDPATGYLYCMYQEFDVDTSAISAGGYPSGEIKISVSTDNGLTWAEGTNITNSVTPSNAAPGECFSEAYPSMAEVVDGNCHILYILDLDAGGSPVGFGVATDNPVVYHKVPVDEIATSPIVDTPVFHVEHLPPPLSTDPEDGSQPNSFALYQNTPNPFNPTTSITFGLETISDVRLSVYNLMGEQIATLVEGVYSIGQHTVQFDGSELASGVYIYRLEAGNRTLEKKMLLVK